MVKKLTDEKIEEIIKLHTVKEMPPNDIARETCVSPSAVISNLKRLGLTTHKNSNYGNELLIKENHGFCTKCNDWKPIKSFAIDKRRNKHEITCNQCKHIRRVDIRSKDLMKHLSYKFSIIKQKTPDTDLIVDDLYYQILNQMFNCFYTDQRMVRIISSKDRKTNGLSIDKLIPSKGYIKGNIVFCCDKINTMKNDLSMKELKYIQDKCGLDWYNRIYRKLKVDGNLHWLDEDQGTTA